MSIIQRRCRFQLRALIWQPTRQMLQASEICFLTKKTLINCKYLPKEESFRFDDIFCCIWSKNGYIWEEYRRGGCAEFVWVHLGVNTASHQFSVLHHVCSLAVSRHGNEYNDDIILHISYNCDSILIPTRISQRNEECLCSRLHNLTVSKFFL